MRTNMLAVSLAMCLGVAVFAHAKPAIAAEPACDVRLSQATLHALGFDAGPIDGLWGTTTATATAAFQAASELPESGALDEVTCSRLETARESGADYQTFLDQAVRDFIVRRDWCGRENLRLECNSGDMLMMSGNFVPCGSTLKTFEDEVGGGMIFPGTHSGVESSCRSLNDFCAYAQIAFGGAFGATCDGRDSFSEETCHEKLWGVCDQ